MEINLIYDPSSPPIAFAAKELKTYLSRMLGESRPCALPTVRLSVEPEEGPDRFAVHITEKEGHIIGGNDRSVLLGVYDYLRCLGCRFLGPGRDSEAVPAIDASALPASYRRRASFGHRGVCIEGADSLENILDFIDWLPKAGYNSFFLQFKLPYAFLARWYRHERNPFREPEDYTVADAAADLEKLEEAVRERGLLLHKVGHGWTGEALGYEALEWHGEERRLPEGKRAFAAQIGGVRGLYGGVPVNTNLCYQNEEAREALVSLVTEHARNHPSDDYIHIWLADAYNNVCECDECRKTTLSDQYVRLLNEIDRWLTAEGLHNKLVFLLYQELLWPPVRERLRNPERFVLMFAPISRTFEASYDVDGPEKEMPPYERNRIKLPTDLGENLAFLRGWQEVFQGDSFVYDYPLGRAHYGDFGYVHIARVIGSDIKRLRQMGLNGYISCQELRASLPNALPNYVMGRMLFEESTDMEEVLDEYFAAAYGGGAVRVRAYLSELSRLSSCDYMNGKGNLPGRDGRENPDIARRMEEIAHVCEAFSAAPEEGFDRLRQPQSLYWRLLEYHRSYVMHLAKAVGCLARGEHEEAKERWRAFQELLCRKEPDFQPYLDVYRIQEVGEHYTGFRP